MNDNQKIKFADKLLETFEQFVEDHADDDMTPWEDKDYDCDGNVSYRFIPTKRSERIESNVDEMACEAENVAGFMYYLVEFLGAHTHGTSITKNNIFEQAIRESNNA